MEPYEKFAVIYDSIMPDRFYQDYHNFIIRILRELELEPRNILELACGTEKLAKLFLEDGYDI